MIKFPTFPLEQNIFLLKLVSKTLSNFMFLASSDSEDVLNIGYVFVDFGGDV